MKIFVLTVIALVAGCTSDASTCSLGNEAPIGVWEAKYTSLSGPCGQISDEIINFDVGSNGCVGDNGASAIRDFRHLAECALMTPGKASADSCQRSVSSVDGEAVTTGLLVEHDDGSIEWTFSISVSQCYGTYRATIIAL